MTRCANCSKPIYASFTDPTDGYIVWAHEDQHTVCYWREDMEPTKRVASPQGGRIKVAAQRVEP